jgi:hypothetical protein
MADNINNPAHYNKGKLETIELIKHSMAPSEFEGYLQGNIIKYISRYRHKNNSLEDVLKAEWYIKRLIKELNESVYAPAPCDTE